MHTSTTLTSGAELRAARAADLPAIERLLTKSQLPLAGVAESLPGFVVAESDGTIVGTGFGNMARFALGNLSGSLANLQFCTILKSSNWRKVALL